MNELAKILGPELVLQLASTFASFSEDPTELRRMAGLAVHDPYTRRYIVGVLTNQAYLVPMTREEWIARQQYFLTVVTGELVDLGEELGKAYDSREEKPGPEDFVAPSGMDQDEARQLATLTFGPPNPSPNATVFELYSGTLD